MELIQYNIYINLSKENIDIAPTNLDQVTLVLLILNNNSSKRDKTPLGCKSLQVTFVKAYKKTFCFFIITCVCYTNSHSYKVTMLSSVVCALWNISWSYIICLCKYFNNFLWIVITEVIISPRKLNFTVVERHIFLFIWMP